MAKTCCVEGCTDIKESVAFFRFPTCRSLKLKWLDALKIAGKVTNKSAVCSRHFTEADYEFVRGKLRLKSRIVPSLDCGRLENGTLNSPKTLKENSGNVLDENVPPDIMDVNDDVNLEVGHPTETMKLNQESTRSESRNDAISPDSLKKTEKDNVNNIVEEKNEESSSPSTKTEIGYKESMNGDDTSNIDIMKMDTIDTINSMEHTEENDGVSDFDISNEIIVEVDFDNDANSDMFMKRGSKSPSPSSPDLNKDDIEDIITNYHIKQTNKPVHATKDEFLENLNLSPKDQEESSRNGEPTFTDILSDEPNFIEISTDKGKNGDEGVIENNDCLMLLENVQVEVDPNMLMLDDQEIDHQSINSDDNDITKPMHYNPISLLTSSDEDDVVIQEPHIDTIEVSDETDEDDLPLVKLITTKKSKKKNDRTCKTKDLAKRNIWNMFQFFCVDCQYTTMSQNDFNKHKREHGIVRNCRVCEYSTSSITQFHKHKRKHKMDKLYKCHLCKYQAKHNMSLLYHMKGHKASDLWINRNDYKCTDCGFKTNNRLQMLKHVQLCTKDKKYSCDSCSYSTIKKIDLKKHKVKKHKEYGDDDDDEYIPPASWEH